MRQYLYQKNVFYVDIRKINVIQFKWVVISMIDLTSRIRKLKFKMTELADYLDISRATLYRYVESYECGHSMDISELSFKTFDYIMYKSNIDKMNVIMYISKCKNDAMKLESKEDILSRISKFIEENPNHCKTECIITMFTSRKLDDAIDFIMQLSPYLDEAGNLIEGGMFDEKPSDSYFFHHEVLKRLRRGLV